jgi:hypothetical protein
MIKAKTPDAFEFTSDDLAQPIEDYNTQRYYKGSTTIYKVAEDFQLNSYEFDIIKRILRCRHKGNWLQDLDKTKDTIDLYIKEQSEKFGK